MDRTSEIIISSSEIVVGNTKAYAIGNIDTGVCYGMMHFLKRSEADEVYIGLAGKLPTPQNYDIVLTDDLPEFSDNVVIGDIKAIGNISTSTISVYVRGGRYQTK